MSDWSKVSARARNALFWMGIDYRTVSVPEAAARIQEEAIRRETTELLVLMSTKGVGRHSATELMRLFAFRRRHACPHCQCEAPLDD